MSTLLAYALLAQPDPPQASATATLTLVVSNTGRAAILCESIVVTLAVGTNAKDIVADPTGIATQPPAGWKCAANGGTMTLTPVDAAAGRIAAGGLAFVFADVALNDQPGTTTIRIDETASSAEHARSDRSASLDLTKFPAEFALSELRAEPAEIAPGGSVQLMWTGSPATYALSYDASGDSPVTETVSNVGPLTVKNLTNAAGVTFTLTATLTVAGRDDPFVVERQVTLPISLPPPSIVAFTGTLHQAGTPQPRLALRWSVRGVQYCFIGIDGVQQAQPAVGSMTIVPSAAAPLSPSYTLTATNASGTVSSTLELTWAARDAIASDSERFFDPATGASDLGDAYDVVITPDGRRAYVSFASALFALDLSGSRRLTRVYGTAPDGRAALALSPDGGTLYLATRAPSELSVNRACTLNVVDTELPLPLAAAPRGGKRDGGEFDVGPSAGPESSIRLSPDGSRLFLAGWTPGTVLVSDGPGHDPATLAIGGGPANAELAPDGSLLFVWNAGGTSIHVFDAVGLVETGAPIEIGATVSAVAFSRDMAQAYVLHHGATVAESAIVAIDLGSRAPLGQPVSTGGNAACALALTPDGSRLIAGGYGALSLFATEPLAHTATLGFALPQPGGGVAVSPDGVTIVAGGFASPVSILLPATVGGGVS
jgi:hypothetical protein